MAEPCLVSNQFTFKLLPKPKKNSMISKMHITWCFGFDLLSLTPLKIQHPKLETHGVHSEAQVDPSIMWKIFI
jgi:hypothetical protein